MIGDGTPICLRLGVNADQWACRRNLGSEIAYEAIFRAYFDMAGLTARAINKHCSYRCRVRIADGQTLETVMANQLIASLLGIGRFWVRIDHARGQQCLF